jgi:hypothetical protein
MQPPPTPADFHLLIHRIPLFYDGTTIAHDRHQAQEGWTMRNTHVSGSSYKFGLLYSHSSGWNRHRGAANKVSGSWSGTWVRLPQLCSCHSPYVQESGHGLYCMHVGGGYGEWRPLFACLPTAPSAFLWIKTLPYESTPNTKPKYRCRCLNPEV